MNDKADHWSHTSFPVDPRASGGDGCPRRQRIGGSGARGGSSDQVCELEASGLEVVVVQMCIIGVDKGRRADGGAQDVVGDGKRVDCWARDGAQVAAEALHELVDRLALAGRQHVVVAKEHVLLDDLQGGGVFTSGVDTIV